MLEETTDVIQVIKKDESTAATDTDTLNHVPTEEELAEPDTEVPEPTETEVAQPVATDPVETMVDKEQLSESADASVKSVSGINANNTSTDDEDTFIEKIVETVKNRLNESDEKYYSRQNRKMISTTKKLIWLLTINGILWIWCSYALAWFDKIQIAESLSSNVCTVIIGQTLGYLITKTVENVFRYNPKLGGESTYHEDVKH